MTPAPPAHVSPHGALDAVVVGAGPNGLSAAVALARAGASVLVLEGEDEVGGAARTGALTAPGYLHDLGSAVHPLAAASPFFRSLPLAVDWVEPPLALAHPLDDRPAATLDRSVAATAASLGPGGEAWAALVEPLLAEWEAVLQVALDPPGWPAKPAAALRFLARAGRSAEGLAAGLEGPAARALVAGLAAHSALPLDRALTGGVALLLALAAHRVGWPFPRGGARRIPEALAAELVRLGGRIETGRRIASLAEVPGARAVLLDVTPWQLLRIAGPGLAPRYRRRLAAWRYGAAAFKVDWALDGPIPWADPACARAGTVHLGGTFEEIADAEAEVGRGGHPERPFVLLSQPTLFDPTRAPPGGHVAWTYTHVPARSRVDVADRIEAQIERFAPGFGARVVARRASAPADLERMDPNLVGGAIGGGVQDLRQMLARPALRDPYRTPLDGVYLCSSSTPPGGGVHGMCGWHAARAAARESLGTRLGGGPEGRTGEPFGPPA